MPTISTTPGRLWERALSQQVASSRFPPDDRTPLGAHFAANRRPLLIRQCRSNRAEAEVPDLCPASLSIGEDSKEGADAGIAGERGDLNPPDSWRNHALKTTFRPMSNGGLDARNRSHCSFRVDPNVRSNGSQGRQTQRRADRPNRLHGGPDYTCPGQRDYPRYDRQAEVRPPQVSAHVGDTIEWPSSDFVAHTATARNKDWDVAIPAKGVGHVMLKHAGDVDYFCRFHPNVTGRISVAP